MALPVKDTMELVEQAMDVVKSRYLLCILSFSENSSVRKGCCTSHRCWSRWLYLAENIFKFIPHGNHWRKHGSWDNWRRACL